MDSQKTNGFIFINPEYRPRYYQIPLFIALHSGIKRINLVWHRRSGKDKTCWEAMLSMAFETPGNYWYMYPEYSQGRKAFWDSIDSNGKRIIDYIPNQLHFKPPSNQEMIVRIKTRANIEGVDPKSHSTIQILGADRPDTLRGSNPKGVIASEYAEWKRPSVLESVVEPVLRENNGWLLVNQTPKGKNHAFRLFEAAKKSDKWFASLLTIEDTQKPDPKNKGNWIPVVSQTDIQEIRNEKQTPEEIIQQEYYCDFNAPPTGVYYARSMAMLEERRAIRDVPYNPHLPTYTAWDLGLNDATAVWFLQVDSTLQNNPVIYAIDYIEYNSVPLPHICKDIISKPYPITANIAPHDIVQRGFESGLSRYEIARQHGVLFMDASSSLTKARKTGVNDGIELTRNLLNHMIFDAAKTEQGLECLRNYKRKYDPDTGSYSNTPVHDKYSHGADALRTFAVYFEDNKKAMTAPKHPPKVYSYQSIANYHD